MISLDWSLIPAIIIFGLTVIALNYLLFRPIMAVRSERERKTTGLLSRTRQDLSHHMQLFEKYQATIKEARLEGYRLLEEARNEALKKRSAGIDAARKNAEELLQESRASIQSQADAAKEQLGRDAEEMARQIAETILKRSA